MAATDDDSLLKDNQRYLSIRGLVRVYEDRSNQGVFTLNYVGFMSKPFLSFFLSCIIYFFSTHKLRVCNCRAAAGLDRSRPGNYPCYNKDLRSAACPAQGAGGFYRNLSIRVQQRVHIQTSSRRITYSI